MHSMISAADDGGYTSYTADSVDHSSTAGIDEQLSSASSTMALPLAPNNQPPQTKADTSTQTSIDFVRSELKRITTYLQDQIEDLGLKMNENRLNEQRARYRDRELIMQAIQKQKQDNNAFTKQVVFNKKTDYSKELKREETLIEKIKVRWVWVVVFKKRVHLTN
jgi:hypothetical protein